MAARSVERFTAALSLSARQSLVSAGGRLYTGPMAGCKHTPLQAAAIGALCALLAIGSVRAEDAPAAGAPKPAADLSLDDTIPAPPKPKKADAAKADGAKPDAAKPAAKSDAAASAAARKRTADQRWLLKSKAVVDVRSKTEGATVLVDGKEAGQTPLAEALKIDPGTHELRLTKPGFADAVRTLKLRPTQKLKVSLEMKAASAADLLAGLAPPPMVVDPEPAEKKGAVDDLPLEDGPILVTADGDLAGAAPAVGPPKGEAVATAQVAAALPKTAAAPAEAVSAAPAPVTDKPLVKRWWFWGGVAAAAVVLVAGVVYALPPQYVERRDPVAACGGAACAVTVNK